MARVNNLRAVALLAGAFVLFQTGSAASFRQIERDAVTLPQCSAISLSWDDGVPPYTANITDATHHTSQALSSTGNTLAWTIDVPVGAEVSFLVVDAKGSASAGGPYQVVTGSTDSCLPATTSSSSSSPSSAVSSASASAFSTGTATPSGTPSATESSASATPTQKHGWFWKKNDGDDGNVSIHLAKRSKLTVEEGGDEALSLYAAAVIQHGHGARSTAEEIEVEGDDEAESLYAAAAANYHGHATRTTAEAVEADDEAATLYAAAAYKHVARALPMAAQKRDGSAFSVRSTTKDTLRRHAAHVAAHAERDAPAPAVSPAFVAL